MRRLCPLGPTIIAALALLGCEELDDFRTRPGEVFRGEVIGSDRDGGTSFIRRGFAPRTLMELTFDPTRASAARELRSAGTIVTYRCPPGETACDRDLREPGHFDAPLEPIASLNNDALSQYDFPGGGRLRNYILGARFTTPGDAGERLRDALVFVSLMEDGRIEARVVAQSLLDTAGQELFPPLFGVFVLDRSER